MFVEWPQFIILRSYERINFDQFGYKFLGLFENDADLFKAFYK